MLVLDYVAVNCFYTAKYEVGIRKDPGYVD